MLAHLKKQEECLENITAHSAERSHWQDDLIHISIHNRSASLSYSPNRFHSLFQVKDELVEDNWVHVLAQLAKITFIFWDAQPHVVGELKTSWASTKSFLRATCIRMNQSPNQSLSITTAISTQLELLARLQKTRKRQYLSEGIVIVGLRIQYLWEWLLGFKHN